jgi:hypothetical protein
MLKPQRDDQALAQTTMACIALKVKSLSLLNAKLRSITDLTKVDDETICAVAAYLSFEVGHPSPYRVCHLI